MKKTLIVIACVLGLGLLAPDAMALFTLSEGDAYYVGSVSPDKPAGEGYELSYLDYLVNMTPETSAVVYGQTFVRSTLAGLPDVIDGNGDPLMSVAIKYDYPKEPDPPVVTPIDVTDLTYVMAKYNSSVGALVWYVADIDDSVMLPTSWNDHNISHYNGVPEGAMTLVLLSVAVVGLEGLRRRFRG